MLPFLVTIVNGALTVAPAVEAAIRLRRAREEQDATRDLEAQRAALEQSWQFMQSLLRQRVLAFGLFAVTTAVFVASYTVALAGELPALAAVIASAGILLVVFLNRFDAVYRAQLIVSEHAIRDLDALLVAAGEPSRAVLLASGRDSQELLILLFQLTAFSGFVAALIYAVVDAV